MLTRRAALQGGTAVATCAAVITAAGAVAASLPPSDSELLALADRYWALRRESARLDDSAPGKSSAEWDAIYDRVGVLDDEAFEIASRIVDLRANTPRGLAAKLRIIRLEAGFREETKQPECHSKYDQAVARGLWTAREDAERLAGRAQS